jgi:hypothetical protein
MENGEDIKPRLENITRKEELTAYLDISVDKWESDGKLMRMKQKQPKLFNLSISSMHKITVRQTISPEAS